MKKCIVLLLLALLCIGCIGCQPASPQKFTAYSLDYFDTATTVIGYETDKADFDAIVEWVFARLEEYHRLYTIYTRYDGTNNLVTVNEAAGQAIKIDPALFDMLAYAKDVGERTDHRTNIAMGAVLSLWHEYRTAGKNDPSAAALPPMDKLLAASGHCNPDTLILDAENGTVTLSDPLMSLDVGAIAKGYAVEQIARELAANGVTGYMLNVGGNIRVIGPKPDGTPWQAGIENPLEDASEPFLAVVALTDRSLVTSGSYQRYYTVDGKEYHHIIDPDTLMPADYFVLVSVIAEDSGLCDALSTALFTLSYEDGMALLERFPDVGALWLEMDGEVRMNRVFEGYLAE